MLILHLFPKIYLFSDKCSCLRVRGNRATEQNMHEFFMFLLSFYENNNAIHFPKACTANIPNLAFVT